MTLAAKAEKAAEKAAEILLQRRTFSVKETRIRKSVLEYVPSVDRHEQGPLLTIGGRGVLGCISACERAGVSISLDLLQSRWPALVFENGRFCWYWIVEEDLS